MEVSHRRISDKEVERTEKHIIKKVEVEARKEQLERELFTVNEMMARYD